ncbi:MAG: hypothetical protein ACM3YM_05620 [Sphingomonadales bacterium]
MRLIFVAGGMIAAFAALPCAAAAREPAGARAFITHIYAGYPRHSPRSQRELDAMFEPELSALIRRSGSNPDEVGPLDGDPICQCQDDTGLRYRIVSIGGAGRQARAVVRNSFVAPARPTSFLVTYRLVRIAGRWRIFDIAGPDQPSMRAWLRRELSAP